VSTSLEELWARAAKGITAAALILDDQGRVLLVKHTYGPLNWEVPGGAAERDETPQQTAEREVLEETGLAVTAERLSGVYYEVHSPGREVLHFMFCCRIVGQTRVPEPSSDEISACGYWSPSALPRPISDFTVRRIEDGLGEVAPRLPVIVTARRWLA
jgi:8-oxo-dGTP pyrophosphatase MutT (NUDIX family)